jgi:tRNA(Ile)-lysidine synthase
MKILRQTALALEQIPIAPGERILIGLSGGADSVALLHLMIESRARFGFEIAAAHFNHHLRGKESERDERFVRELCQRLGVSLIVAHAGALRDSRSNVEERAREARHKFLSDAAKQIGAKRIALGHHRDDQAETVMMRLMRGAGVAGLSGMAQVGVGRIMRPLLGLSREQILAYLVKIGEAFVTDSSNESAVVLRNRIRHELLPSIERDYAPGFSDRLAKLAQSMRDLHGLVSGLARDEVALRLRDTGEFDLTRFGALNPALQLATVRALIERRMGTLRRIGRVHIEALGRLCLEGPPNGSIDLPWGWIALRSYERLSLYAAAPAVLSASGYDAELVRDGTTLIADCRYQFDSAFVKREAALESANQECAWFDVERIEAGLRVRNFHAGDRIRPIGMKGTRKAKKIFIEERIPISERHGFPMVTLGQEVAWMPGLKRGSVALIGTDTKWVMKVEARRR